MNLFRKALNIIYETENGNATAYNVALRLKALLSNYSPFPFKAVCNSA